ncbi:hypothetical protein OG455_00555 [Kitasatospora sp. NBC_01287]|uniref:hypothetical protein n=1 Tax=Kitasatospora sp. NBC_01287 TaxID=2903573 RepID=UPI002257DE6E|nr:hypothetical protein [Kitasatospora sp. NBC_01287]MCX4744016.1 hypothetical protein [Kitasatospora sp. NBC_01287]
MAIQEMARPAVTHRASERERLAATALMAEPETVVSDPPLFSPQAVGALLLGLLLSPKTPKERAPR